MEITVVIKEMRAVLTNFIMEILREGLMLCML